MDFTKQFCAIERKKGDFFIYPTKYIFYKDPNGGFVSVGSAEATGPLEQLFAMNENSKPMPIERVIKCSDDLSELKKSVNTNKRIKLKKSLSIAENVTENKVQKKKRLLDSEKENVILKRKQLVTVANKVAENADSHFFKYLKKPSNQAMEKFVKKNEDPDKEINQDQNMILVLQDVFENISNIEASHNKGSNNVQNDDVTEFVSDLTLPLSEENFLPSDASSILSSAPSLSIHNQQEEINNNNNNNNNKENELNLEIRQENANFIVDEEENLDLDNLMVDNLQCSPANHHRRKRYFENLWPETNCINSNSDNRDVNINQFQLKQCLKEFGEYFFTNLINHQNISNEAGNVEFEIPPVENNKIKICGFDLDADEIFKAKDVVSMRMCANHVIRAYWPLEMRKKMVLSKRAGQPDDRIQVTEQDLNNLKKICKFIQKGCTFDTTKEQNKLSNFKKWVEEILKNDRRPPKLGEDIEKMKQKAKLRRQQKKRLNHEQGGGGHN